ncbi:MAG: hypothetical protein QG597_1608 [Actinomycetota bacterium]|nr:hypothetical protein [Actinomycetota bacterium]
MPGTVLTFDALHAVKKTIELAVVEKQADVLICVKDNAPELRQRIEKHLDRNAGTLTRAQTVNQGHGRIETRNLEMAPILPSQTGWPHTHVVCRVMRERQLIRRGEVTGASQETVLYVGSFAADAHSPERVLGLTRGHWTIENCLHHPKDRSMDEDRNRASAGKSGRVMCCLRSIAALVLGRARESLSVVQRRLSRRVHLLLGLFSCTSVAEWERRYEPYKLKLA